MNRKGFSVSTKILQLLFRVSVLLSAVGIAALAPHLTDSAELVRLRNALLLDNEPAMLNWTPESIPPGFAVETRRPNALFLEAVEREGLRAAGNDWQTALRIGAHLLKSGVRNEVPIQSDLDNTYHRITEAGDGYCGDFADVFTGLASAAGVFSRSWAFSFDGFGGRGHIFNEIWDRTAQRWLMIDVFNNIYFVDSHGRPLSALEVRGALEKGSPVRLVPVSPDARPGFRHESKALEYFRRGLPEWYMWWGNNVFAYDQSPLVRSLGGAPRALEQLGGIAEGVFPRIRIMDVEGQRGARDGLVRLRVHLYFVAISTGLAVVFGVLNLAAAARRRRQAKFDAVNVTFREGA